MSGGRADEPRTPRGESSGAASICVGLPVFNGARYLEEAILSVQRQTLPPTSLLVFDNASTDGSAEIAERLVGPTGVRRARENAGAIQNFNRAVLESSGDYFLWLAGDDYLDPRHLDRCLDVLRAHPERSACLPGIRFVGRDGRLLRTVTDSRLGSTQPRVRFRSYLHRIRWTETYCLFRRDVLLRSPMFTQEFGTDVLLMWWFLLRGPLAVVEEPLLNYREYPKTIEEVVSALDPAMGQQHWRKCRMWRALWRHTRDPELGPRTARAARQELLLLILSRYGAWHLADDVVQVVTDLASRHSLTRGLWVGFLGWLRVLLRRPQE